MITYSIGNLLEANAEALVNTVNTVGVMGKGIALQFKQAFPKNFVAYQKACRNEEFIIGKILVVPTYQFINPKYIFNFPTKRHWREKTKLEYIELGLQDLVKLVCMYQIQSIAIPPLGCGFGGLNWSDVKPLIRNAASHIPEVQVTIYEPGFTPKPEEMKVNTKRPALTFRRAGLIILIDRYRIAGYKLTLLEIQKLAYFLQAFGEPLKLNFGKNKFGPYAEELNFVLQRLEGHYIRGYGDRSQSAAITLTPGAAKEAEKLLKAYPETLGRVNSVVDLIHGFETPYGLELLATLYWLIFDDKSLIGDMERAVNEFLNWNTRKRNKFNPKHIEIAWKKIKEEIVC
jgi:O-acetyl-ADP-ribose deacetylase (regulator of RNase III)